MSRNSFERIFRSGPMLLLLLLLCMLSPLLLHLFPFSSLFLPSIDKRQSFLPKLYPSTIQFFNRVSNPWLFRTSSWNRKKIFSSLQDYIYISSSILNFIDVLIRFNMLLNWLLKLMSCYGYGCHVC